MLTSRQKQQTEKRLKKSMDNAQECRMAARSGYHPAEYRAEAARSEAVAFRLIGLLEEDHHERISNA